MPQKIMEYATLSAAIAECHWKLRLVFCYPHITLQEEPGIIPNPAFSSDFNNIGQHQNFLFDKIRCKLLALYMIGRCIDSNKVKQGLSLICNLYYLWFREWTTEKWWRCWVWNCVRKICPWKVDAENYYTIINYPT